MPFKIGLSFSIDREDSAELLEKLNQVIALHRETRMLNSVPNELSILERLGLGREIFHKELAECNDPEFTERVITAADDAGLDREKMEQVEVTMALFRETIKEQFKADQRVILLFRQYVEMGG